MSEWEQGASVPRFGIDQWHIAQPGNLTELEHWPEVNGTPSYWQVTTVCVGPDDKLYISRFTESPDFDLDQAKAWGQEQRRIFLEELNA